MGLSKNNCFGNSVTLEVIEEEVLEDLLHQYEDDEDSLRPIPVKSANERQDGLPWCVDVILRICRYICRV